MIDLCPFKAWNGMYPHLFLFRGHIHSLGHLPIVIELYGGMKFISNLRAHVYSQLGTEVGGDFW